jgi:hypothetical protein
MIPVPGLVSLWLEIFLNFTNLIDIASSLCYIATVYNVKFA